MCHLRKQKRLGLYNQTKYLRVANHKFEVVIAVDTRAEVLVVVLKLLDRNDVVPLVSLPDLHEVGEHLVSRLPATLEVGVEAHIVDHLNVLNSHLATPVLVEHGIGLVDHVSAAVVQVASDGPQEFVKGKLSVLVGVEVLHNLSHLDVGEGDTVVTHRVLKLDGAERTISVPVHGLEHAAQASESVGTSLTAKINHLLLNLFEVADLHVLLHVWVANVQITALGPGKRNLGLLSFKVDVALVAYDSLSLVERLSETTGLGEGVRARRGTHVGVLSLKRLCVNSDGAGLCVIALGNSRPKLLVCGLGSAPRHTALHSEVLVATVVANKLAVLGLHNFAADSVGCHVSAAEVLSISRIKVTLLVPGLNRCVLFSHLLSHLAFNLTLKILLFAADAGYCSC